MVRLRTQLFKMHVFLPISLALLHGSLASASPTPSLNTRTCTDPVVRKEWRTLSSDEQADYLRAVQCLADKPSSYNFGNSTRLYDNFPEIHVILDLESVYNIYCCLNYSLTRCPDSTVHKQAAFLPW